MQLNQHSLPDGLQSVNGSDYSGGCSRPAARGLICTELDEGGTSDLTDCVIPSLGRFQSNWAAGLFTVNRSGQSFHIVFEFSRPVNFTRVELDLFNCPECKDSDYTLVIAIMQWELQLKDKEAYMWVAAINIISTEFAHAGWCSAWVEGKRSVQYCWLIKEHDDEKSGFCDTM